MAENFSWQDRLEFSGTISEVNSNAKFVVLLDDGRTVTASISNYTARRMLSIISGDRVRIKFRALPKLPRIIGFQ